jgi:hypothetical protein
MIVRKKAYDLHDINSLFVVQKAVHDRFSKVSVNVFCFLSCPVI